MQSSPYKAACSFSGFAGTTLCLQGSKEEIALKILAWMRY